MSSYLHRLADGMRAGKYSMIWWMVRVLAAVILLRGALGDGDGPTTNLWINLAWTFSVTYYAADWLRTLWRER